jgi:glutathione peroxidase
MTDRPTSPKSTSRAARVFLALAALFSASPAPAADGRTAHDFAFTAIDGAPLPLASFKGKALLVVNTASLCGFTPQYKDLQALWERYRDRGLVVLGVPSDDFGNQEPGTEAEIKKFCELNYGIDFPLAGKAHVVGDEAHPFYRWAAAQLGFTAKPRWNFHKYLVAPDGRLVDWFSSPTSPTAGRVTAAIEALLLAAAPTQ